MRCPLAGRPVHCCTTAPANAGACSAGRRTDPDGATVPRPFLGPCLFLCLRVQPGDGVALLGHLLAGPGNAVIAAVRGVSVHCNALVLAVPIEVGGFLGNGSAPGHGKVRKPVAGFGPAVNVHAQGRVLSVTNGRQGGEHAGRACRNGFLQAPHCRQGARCAAQEKNAFARQQRQKPRPARAGRMHAHLQARRPPWAFLALPCAPPTPPPNHTTKP